MDTHVHEDDFDVDQVVREEPETAAATLEILLERMDLIQAITDPEMEVHFTQIWPRSLPDELREQLLAVGRAAAEESWRLIQAYEETQQGDERA